jgi:hypothetical protein
METVEPFWSNSDFGTLPVPLQSLAALGRKMAFISVQGGKQISFIKDT